MALTLYSGWDHARIGTATIAWNDGSARTASITTDTAAHVDLSGVMGTGNYKPFAGILDAAMDAVSATITPTFSTTTNLYTLRRTSSWTMTIGTTTLMRNILGVALADGSYPIAAVNTSGSNWDIISTRTPYYALACAIGGKSQVTDDYEPDGIAVDGEADDGSSYGIARTTAPTYHDFVVPLEAKATTFSRSAAAGVPWTFQHFVQHARNFEPFAMYDGSTYEVLRQRADGAVFKPSRVVADYDNFWSWPIKARLLGRV